MEKTYFVLCTSKFGKEIIGHYDSAGAAYRCAFELVKRLQENGFVDDRVEVVSEHYDDLFSYLLKNNLL